MKNIYLSLVCVTILTAMTLPPPTPGPGNETPQRQQIRPDEEQTTQSSDGASKTGMPSLEQPLIPGQTPRIANPGSQAEPERQPHSEPSTHKEPEQPSWPNIVPNWIMAIFTVALTLVAFLQWRTLRSQASYMRDNLVMTQGIAKATIESAHAATHSAHTAELALKTTERAYLTIGHWVMDGLRDSPQFPGPMAVVSFHIINSGRTPAYILNVWLNYVSATELPETPCYSGAPRSYQLNLSPQACLAVPFGLEYVPTPSSAINDQQPSNPRYMLWFWGRIMYRDVFARQYVMGFTARYQPSSTPFIFPPTPGYTYENEQA